MAEDVISISTGGVTIGPVPVSRMREALDEVRGRKRPKVKETEADRAEADRVHGIAVEELRALVERAEAQIEVLRGEQEVLKEIFGEAKWRGYDVKIMRRIIALRAMDASVRAEQDAVLATYCEALGL